jgi:hypothetical protein
MQLEKGTVQRTAQAAAEEMEKDRLYRELNAHTMGLSFNPPTYFSKGLLNRGRFCLFMCSAVQQLCYEYYTISWSQHLHSNMVHGNITVYF